jgi:hypothetical protein
MAEQPDRITFESVDPVTLARDLVDEAQSVRRRYEGTWDRNNDRYKGKHWDKVAPTGRSQFSLNLIQNAVIAASAVQTEQRPRTEIVPRETNDPPIYYMTDDGAAKLRAIPQQILDPQQAAGQTPFNRQQAEALIQTLGVPGVDEMGVQTQPTIDADVDIIEVGDETVADAIQAVLGIMWDRSSLDYHLVTNILNTGVVGFQPFLCQWNEETSLPEFVNVNQFQTWIDPLATSTTDADYFCYDEIIPADRAKRLYPEFAEVIERNKSQDPISEHEFGNTVYGRASTTFIDTQFKRDMVTIRTFWKRGVAFPMTMDEALESGQVQEVPLAPPVEGIESVPQYALAETDEITAEGEANWPTRSSILQAKVIGKEVIQKIECPFVDIPFGWNINIPIPHTPYGQGEPERLEDLQQLINRIASILHDHLKFYQSPETTMPQSMFNTLKKNDLHAYPGRYKSVPDELYMQFGGKIVTHEPIPPLPTTYVDLLNRALDLFQTLSGNQDVLQGQSPGADTSARAIEALQVAARGPIGFKSMNTERMLVHVTRLMIGMILDFLPEAKWVKMVGKYPVQVLRALRNRAKVMDYDVIIEVVSGKGNIRKQNQDLYLQLAQMGKIADVDLLKRLDIPNAEELSARNQQQMAAMAQAAAPPPQG